MENEMNMQQLLTLALLAADGVEITKEMVLNFEPGEYNIMLEESPENNSYKLYLERAKDDSDSKTT